MLTDQRITTPTSPPEVFEGREGLYVNDTLAVIAGKRIRFFRMSTPEGGIEKSGVSSRSPHSYYSLKNIVVITVDAYVGDRALITRPTTFVFGTTNSPGPPGLTTQR